MATRVLVVDDSPTIRRVVGAVLQRHGFEAVPAEDGQDALDQLLHSVEGARGGNGEATKIDIALVDFVMPRMNGFQLCRAIRQNADLHGLPIILMSAKSDRIRDHFVQQTGAIDAIGKPFDSRALLAVIENAVRRAEQWRAKVDAISVEFLDDLEVKDDAGGVAQGGEGDTALSGDLSVIPIGAVLQLLQLEGQTGTLLATDGKTEVTIAMRQGLIDLVQAHGAGNEFRLGRYFVEHAWVAPEDIDRLLQDQLAKQDPPWSGHKRLGDLLVESGRVTQEQLREALSRQSSELVYELLRWPRGRFEFRPAEPRSLANNAGLGLPVASVVMEGFRRVDEWRLVEGGLGSFDSVLLVDSAGVQAVGMERLARSEQKLLEMIDGERSVRDIVAGSHMSSFDACKILYQLIEARLVRRRPT
jgi:DNA-binding response OmpR family regulator